MKQSLFDLVPDYFPEWLNQNNLESGTGGDYRLEQERQLRFERYPRTFNQILTRSGFDGFSKCRKVTVGYSIIGIRFASWWGVQPGCDMTLEHVSPSVHPAYRPTISGSRNVHTWEYHCYSTYSIYSIICTCSVLRKQLRILTIHGSYQ